MTGGFKFFSSIRIVFFLIAMGFYSDVFATPIIPDNRTAILLAQSEMSESQAAAIAKSKHGGKVLSVDKQGKSRYRVKLLLESGRIKYVTIEDEATRKN